MSQELLSDVLLEAVLNEEGLTDFGNDYFLGNYRRAVESITREVNLSPQGMSIVSGSIRSALTNVLRMQSDLKKHPEIYDEILAPPIVITGFGRTGSTKLQRIVSACPGVQSLKLWKLLNPAPFPNAPANGPDPRIAVAEAGAWAMQKNFPEFWASHPQPADDAEEDFLLHNMTFNAPVIGMQYGAWELTRALTPVNIQVFEFLRTMLQYLQWQDGSSDRASRPWVLKSPIHIGNVPTFQKVFPGAKFVYCHRNVTTLVASLCSFTQDVNRMVSDTTDSKAHARNTLAYWAAEWDRNLDHRAQLDPDTFIDIHFDDINHEGLKAAETVHRFAGLPFDQASRQAARAWEEANPRHKGGLHVYNLADFDLTEADVHRAFSKYYDYFEGTDLLR